MYKKLFFALLCMGCILSSCDDRYDMNKDISNKVELFSDGLGIPIGSTGQLKLDSLINENNFLLIDADGNYYLSVQGELGMDVPYIDTTRLKIEGVEYSGTRELHVSTNQFSRILRHTPSKSELSFTLERRDTIMLNLDSETPPELRALRKATLKNPASISISTRLTNVPPSLQNTPIKIEFTIQFPDAFKISGTTNGQLTLSGSVLNEEPLSSTKYLNELVFNDLYTINDHLAFTDSISYVMRVSIPISTTLTPTEITALEAMQFSYDVKIGDMAFQTVTAKIDVSLDPQQAEASLADFAQLFDKNPNNKLDLQKAHITLDVNTPIPFHPSLSITPSKNGVDKSPENVSLSLKTLENNRFFLSNVPSEATPGYEGIFMNTVGLLNSIPDLLKIKWFASIDTSKWFTFDFFIPHHVSASYQAIVPMAFGPDFRITLQDTIAFHFQSEDLDSFLETGSVFLKGNTVSSFPLSLVVSLQALDEYDYPIDNLDFMIGMPTFEIELKSEQIKQIERVRKWVATFQATPIPGQEAVLSSGQYFQLLNLSLKTNGPIILN